MFFSPYLIINLNAAPSMTRGFQYMGVISNAKYSFFNLPRSTRHWIILKDVKGELDFTKKVTKIALESDALDKPKDFDKEDDDFSF